MAISLEDGALLFEVGAFLCEDGTLLYLNGDLLCEDVAFYAKIVFHYMSMVLFLYEAGAF